jgi:putative methionine-R-sulfoxide reductase with GAF domain
MDSLAQAHRRAEQRYEFLQGLASCHSAEEAADLTAGFLESTLGTRRVSVMIADDENVLRIAASRGISKEIVEQVAVPVGARLCGEVFATGQPVLLHDIQTERPQDALGLEGAGAVICCPMVTAQMIATGRTIGVINVTDAPGGEFSNADMTELKSVAKAAAIGLAGQIDHQDLEQSNYASIVSLAVAMEAKDLYTNGHSSRVHHWATGVGRAMGLDGRRLQILGYAGRLHDIGKLAIPDAILNAKRELTLQEWAAIHQHPQRGVEMIKHLRFLKDAQPAIRHHHEHLDGSGYPDGLSGDEIPLEARIIAVVDAYDAMMSARAYRPAMPHQAAAAELRMYAGTQFDPQVVETFLHLLSDEVTCAVGEETRAYDE